MNCIGPDAQLPAFLDNLELHYRRLGEVDSQQLLEYGYPIAKDFACFFQDRTLASNCDV